MFVKIMQLFVGEVIFTAYVINIQNMSHLLTNGKWAFLVIRS